MAELIRVGAAGDPSEFGALTCLEKELPDQFLVLANCQVPDRGSLIEVDALVIGAPGIFILEIKNWRGEISGTDVGTWRNDGTEVKNPIHQVKKASQNVKSFITKKENAKKIFVPDPRVATSIRTWAVVVFCDAQANISKVKLTDSPHWLWGCMTLPDLVRKIHAQLDQTMHRLKPEEMCNLARAIGATKRDVDEWFARQSGQGALIAPALPPQPSAPYVAPPPVVPPPPASRWCPQCGNENRANAKFCNRCRCQL